MGRNMFGPVRGDWHGEWSGWWGSEPPYHGPVFVLTHYQREPLAMEGGTTFHFVTDGIESALAQAQAVPGDGNVAIAGGASTVNQYLAAGLLDELRLHITPFTLGTGTRVFDGVPPLEAGADLVAGRIAGHPRDVPHPPLTRPPSPAHNCRGRSDLGLTGSGPRSARCLGWQRESCARLVGRSRAWSRGMPSAGVDPAVADAG